MSGPRRLALVLLLSSPRDGYQRWGNFRGRGNLPWISETLLCAATADNSWPAGATQQQFLANQSVTWAVTGGSANGTVNGSGLYTAPALVPNPATVTLTATSPTAAGSAFVTVAAPTALGTSQITVAATAVGGPAHGSVVTLTVQ